MKKISKTILIALIAFLIVPLIAKADMGAPEMTTYKVVVTDKDGVALYDWDNKKIATIPVDEILEITFEDQKNDAIYGYTMYKNETGYINLSDVKMYKEELTPEDGDSAYRSTGKMYVFKEGAKLYKGPSFAFDLVTDDEIKVGTTLEYTYKDEQWIYTEYKGKKGWVYYYSYYLGDGYKTSSLANIVSGKILTIDDVEIYKDVEKNEKLEETIPAGEELTFKYTYYPYAKTTALYINYKGTEGWVFKQSYMGESDKDFLIRYKTQIFLVEDKEFTVYKDYKCEDKLGSLNGNKAISSLYTYSYVDDDNYNYEYRYYVEYKDGKYGWVAPKDLEVANRGLYIYETTDDTNLYTSPSKDDKKESKIPKGKKVKSLFYYYDKNHNTWIYIEEDDYKGWILEDEDTVKGVESYELDEEDEKVEEAVDPEEEKKKKKDDDEINDSGMSTMQIVVIAVVSAIVLAFTTVIIIVVINMKKKKI